MLIDLFSEFSGLTAEDIYNVTIFLNVDQLLQH